MRAWVCMGVRLCVRLFMRAPLFSSRLTRAATPFVLNTSCSFSCPWHALLLPSSSTPGVARCFRVSRFSVSFLKRAAPPLVLNTNPFMSRAAPLPRVLRAVYRLTPVTYPARARATRAMLATSGDAPAQPGPADAALPRSLRRRPSWRPAQACLDGGVGGPVQQRPCSSRRRPGRRLAHIYGGPAPPWPGSFKRSRQLPLQRLALMAGRHCRGPALLTAALACERLALTAS